MRRNPLLATALLIAVGVMALAAASSSASAHKTTLKYFFKSTGMLYQSPSGANLSNNAAPAVGDHFVSYDDAYTGDSAHHAGSISATAALECTITDVINPNSNIKAICQGAIAIGNSMLVSTSQQNVATNNSVYPITGGTGVYAGAKGSVKSTNVGKTNNSNVVVTFTG